MDLPTRPFFVPRYRDESGGVDYLGLRAVNLRFMDEFLPGINNVTSRIRPYSLMCWAAAAYFQDLPAHAIDSGTHDGFVRFREKVEVLFNWSHRLAGDDAGHVGREQKLPAANAVVPLTFAAWKRNVSVIDAANYGPSLKTDNGLGFLVQTHRDVFVPTKAGTKLAAALDKSLARLKDRDRLARTDDLQGDEGFARDLYDGWVSKAPTPEESEIFRDAFYQAEAIEAPTRAGERSASLHLVLLALRRAGRPLTADEVRRSLCFDPLADDPADGHATVLRARQRLWQVLQVRQAQRLAFEALFGWAESRLIDGRTLSVDLAEDLLEELRHAGAIADTKVSVAGLLGDALLTPGSGDRLLRSGNALPHLDIFRGMLNLGKAISRGDVSVSAQAVALLMLSAGIARGLSSESDYLEYLRSGGGRRVSLDHWQRYVFTQLDAPLSEFLLSVFENFILSQHFGVAASRYSEGKQRLRITIEERGLTSMVNARRNVWRPGVTPDRLEAALDLMAESGLTERTKLLGQSHYVAH